MARKQNNGFNKFNLEDSNAMKNIEDIYDEENAAVVEQEAPAVQQVAQGAPAAQQMPQEAVSPKVGNSQGMKPLKSEKGVKIMLPMDYYFKLVQIKACTGKTLQELAAQGVMEFIERFEQENKGD